MTTAQDGSLTRGYRKKERTRRRLMNAGLRVLAEKGQGLTVSDVVLEAEVSSGTFYNYFNDREELLEALAEHSALSLAAAVAAERISDPARRFARATMRVLSRAAEDETWGRVVIGLVSRPGTGIDLGRYLREDLAEGLEKGRFDVGPEAAVVDQVAGLVVMTIRRFLEGQTTPNTAELAVRRALRSVGVSESESVELAAEAAASLRADECEATPVLDRSA